MQALALAVEVKIRRGAGSLHHVRDATSRRCQGLHLQSLRRGASSCVEDFTQLQEGVHSAHYQFPKDVEGRQEGQDSRPRELTAGTRPGSGQGERESSLRLVVCL